MIEDFNRDITNSHTVDIKQLAKIQLFLFDLKEIKISDWFVQKKDGYTDARLRLKRLILNGARVIDAKGRVDASTLDSDLSSQYWYEFGMW